MIAPRVLPLVEFMIVEPGPAPRRVMFLLIKMEPERL